MQQYKDLIAKIQSDGYLVDEDRTGTGTKAIFGHTMRFNLMDGFPLLTLKKTPWKPIRKELEWFLSGSTSNLPLADEGVKIWNEWADEKANLGPIYSAMWRRWPTSNPKVVELDLTNHIYSNDDQLPEVLDVDPNSKVVSKYREIVANGAVVNIFDLYRNEYKLFKYIHKSNVSNSWHSFDQFIRDISALGGYELWLESPHLYALSRKYYNSDVFSKNTSIFIPFAYENELNSYLGDLNTTISIGSNEYKISTKTDILNCLDVDHILLESIAYKCTTIKPGEFNVYAESYNSYIKLIKSDKVGKIFRREYYIDQVANAIDQLKTNHTSRRIIVSGWNPSVLPDPTIEPSLNPALGNQALPPCHTLFQFNVGRDLTKDERINWLLDNVDGVSVSPANDDDLTDLLEKYDSIVPTKTLDCLLYQRSTDVGLGLPFNIASYSLLTALIAHECGYAANEFIHISGNAHIYNNHDELLNVLNADEYDLPKLKINPSFKSVLSFKCDDVELLNYKSGPHVKLDVSV